MNFESMMTISNVFHQHIAKQKNMKLAMIHDAVKFHYDNCSEYKIFCESQGFKPEDLKEYEDLKKVPLIPIDTFKDPEHRMLSIPRKKIRGVVESSGTSGIPSIAFKDTQILFRDVIALIVQYTEFIDIFGDFGMFFLVSPTDMPTLGASKMLGVLSTVLTGFDYVIKVGKEVDFEEVIKKLKYKEGEITRHLIGAPYLLFDFANFIQNNPSLDKFPLDEKSMIITIGGWKRYKGEVCSRENFNNLMLETFNVPIDRIRDIYGTTESNVFLMECEYNQKHVPSWGHISIRDFDNPTEKEVELGEEGIMGILDPLSTTYPGFILTGDVARVVIDGECQCGRTGQVIKFERRVTGAEQRSCALHMDTFLQSVNK